MTDRLSDELNAPDAIAHMISSFDFEALGPTPTQKEFVRAICAKNPDFHLTVEDFLMAEDKLVIRGKVQVNNPATDSKSPILIGL